MVEDYDNEAVNYSVEEEAEWGERIKNCKEKYFNRINKFIKRKDILDKALNNNLKN